MALRRKILRSAEGAMRGRRAKSCVAIFVLSVLNNVRHSHLLTYAGCLILRITKKKPTNVLRYPYDENRAYPRKMHASLNKYQMGNSRLLRTAEAMKIRSTVQLMYTAGSITEGEEARH